MCFSGSIGLNLERSSVCSCGKSSIDQWLERVLKLYADIRSSCRTEEMLLARQPMNESVTLSLKTFLCFETHSNKTQLHIILKGFQKYDDGALGYPKAYNRHDTIEK